MEQENKKVYVNEKRNFIDKLFKLKKHGTTINGFALFALLAPFIET